MELVDIDLNTDQHNEEKAKNSPSPFDEASCPSRLYLTWVNQYLKNQELPADLPKFMAPDRFYPTLVQEWEKQKKTAKPNLLTAIFKTYWFTMFRYSSPMMAEMAFQTVIGILIGMMIQFIMSEDEDDTYGWGLVVGIVVVSLWSYHLKHPCWFFQVQLSAVIRESLLRLLHDKVVNMSYEVMNNSQDAGKIINVATFDIDIFEFVHILNALWYSPMFFFIIIIAIYFITGVAGIVGVIVLSFLVPLQISVGKLNEKLRMKVGQYSDERIKLTTEIVEGIRVLKMYAWELVYNKRILEKRSNEMNHHRFRGIIRASNMSLFLSAQGIAVFVTFLVYDAMGEEITPEILFSTLSLLVSTQMFLTILFPFAYEFFSNFKAGSKRFAEVLMLPDHVDVAEPAESNGQIVLEDVEASWIKKPEKKEEEKPANTEPAAEEIPLVPIDKSISGEEEKSPNKEDPFFMLRELNYEFKPGSLTMVIGKVGAGKSCLLLTILGEVHLSGGKVKRSGKIGYLEQEPWIISGTVRENITLGTAFDEDHYQKTLQACGLRDDIERMEKGDQTKIGERGVTLSGGQKARVGLARCLYAKCDIYLLDDPLSAVDVRVGRHIFQNCIKGMMKDATVILVTHQKQYASQVDAIIEIDEGSMSIVPFEKIEVPQEEVQVGESEEKLETGEAVDNDDDDEEEMLGNVSFKTYAKMLCAGYWWLVPLIVILCFVVEVLFLAVPFWLAVWSEQGTEEAKDPYYLEILGYIVIILLVIALLRNNLLYQNILTASRNMHDILITKLARSKVQFFDQNTSGKIMGRCSKDIAMMDDFLSWMFSDMVQVMFIAFGAMIAMIIGNPFLAVIAIPVVIGLIIILKKGVGPSRQSHRLMLSSKTPIFSHLSLISNGLYSIRAFNLIDTFKEKFQKYTTQSTKYYLAHFGITFWMHFRCDLVGAFYISCNLIVAMAARNELDKSTLAVGLSLTITLIINLVWVLFQMVHVEALMASPERMFRFSQIEEEGAITTDHELKVSEAKIEFKDVVLKYDPEKVVTALKSVNFVIPGGVRVGICGRTGAGKSSIMVVLFRLFECTGGTILIDDQDISKIGLHSLRSQISCIPQTPFIFTASLRYNLDPMNEYSDDDLWLALAHSKLKDFFKDKEEGLDHEMNAGTLSAGQKQLLCLARALLKKNKIMVMDEATANVDYETDEIIQDTVKREFKNCTFLTIAHRIDTIINYNKIIVMDKGEVAEFDSPASLMKRPESIFKDLVKLAKAEDKLITES